MKRTLLSVLLLTWMIIIGLSSNAQLSGTYTIDVSQAASATNFQTFKSAVDTLVKYGVNSPVIFNVAAGTYNERVVVTSITGTSPLNTITFDGGAGNASTRIITNNGVTATRATFQIANSPYITLRNLTIQTTGSFGWGVNILAGSNTCKVKSCIIDITGAGITSTSAADFHGIVINNSATAVATGVRIDSIEIDSNTINYGAYGIVQVGVTGSIALNNKFRNNIINNSYTYGIYLNYHDNAEISGNTVTLRSGGIASRGIYLQNSTSTGSNYTRITGNKILNPGAYGISIAASSNSGTQKGLLANNAIGVGFQNTTSYGMHLLTSDRWNIYHNSINKDIAGTAATRSALYIQSGNSITVYNNILAITGTGSGLPFYAASAASIDSMDYNLFYTVNTSGDLLYAGSAFNSSNFTGGAGFNVHSLLAAPFISDTSLHINTGCNNGLYINSLATDINDNPRNNPPDIGAAEYFGLNNISIDGLLQPVVGSIQSGLQDIIVRVKNTGANAVSTFNIRYSLNNSSPVSLPWAGSLAPCDTVSITFTGINLLNENQLTVYTDQPNSSGDTNPENDTLTTLLYASLNGVYTIGQSGATFASFNEAITHLTIGGVSGPVVFNVQTGTYTEQVVIPVIIGASATNTVTFQSAANHADSVTLNYNAGATIPIVKLDNASYTNFKFITVTSLIPTAGFAFELAGTASCDSIINCKIRAGNTGIYASSLSGGKNVFSHNLITGGTSGILLSGISTAVRSDSNIMSYNTIQNTSDYGCFFYNTQNLKITNNTITGGSYGLSSQDNYGALSITSNVITSTTNYGLYVYYAHGSIATPALIANNSIISNGDGIQNSYGSYQRFYHNTISAVTYGIYVSYNDASDSANEWKNNIITSSGATGNAANISNNATNNVWDYNLYYTNGKDLFYNDPLYTNTFANWQTTGQDSHSMILDPGFVSATDLHLTAGCKQGMPLAAVTIDGEGNPRNNPPTVGVYEYLDINNIAIDGLVQPGFPVASGLQDLKVRVKNTGTNAVNSFNIGYILNNDNLISQQWTGSLAPCDTITVTFSGTGQVNIIADTLYTLKIFTHSPNNNQDTYKANDTIIVSLGTPLNGTYTLGGTGGDFPDFRMAEKALNMRGVAGPVTFNVAAGTAYTEPPFLLTEIQGNNLYGITFQKAGTGANPVIYGINGIGTMDAVITLKGTSNITFDGIDVADSISNSTNIIRMEYGYKIINADAITGTVNNTIKNSKIMLNKTNASSIGILQSSISTFGGASNATLLSGSNRNNHYENIQIENSYNGILLTGNATYPDSGNVITASAGDTTIIANLGGGTTTVYAIQLVNQKDPEISNSLIRNLTTSNATAHGIYLNNTSTAVNYNYGNAIINNNRVYNVTTTSSSTTADAGVHGIRIDVSPNATATVFNNVVYNLVKGNPTSPNANSLIRGISHCASGNGDASYFNNTVLVTPDLSLNVSSTAFWKGGTGTATIARNNVFVNTAGVQTGNARHFAIYINTNTSILADHNLLWSANANGFSGGRQTTYLQTLNNWQTSTGQDANSVTYLPDLSITNHLKPNVSDSSSWALNGRAIHLSSTLMSTDINGSPRPSTIAAGVPDIGAYEFTPTSVSPLAIPLGLPAPDSLQIFISPFSNDTVASIKWDPSVVSGTASVRQYTGVKPPQIGDATNYMYFYTEVIVPAGSGSFTNVYYRESWLGTIISKADLKLMNKPVNGPWNQSALTSAFNSTDTVRHILTDYTIDVSGYFTGSEQVHPLPVNLLNLSAHKRNKDVIVNWSTASEVNVSHFEIERSLDGRSFTKIGAVKGKGSSNSVSNYQLTDLSPFTVSLSTLYYRLKIADADGKYEYSKNVFVNSQQPIANSQQSIVVYPNPFNKEVFVKLETEDASTVKIALMDITGKTITNNVYENIKGGDIIPVSKDEILKAGIYFLSVEINGIRQIQKLIKQ